METALWYTRSAASLEWGMHKEIKICNLSKVDYFGPSHDSRAFAPVVDGLEVVLVVARPNVG